MGRAGYRRTILTACIVSPCLGLTYAQENPKRTTMLTGRYSQKFLVERMLPRDAWRPFPPASDRHAWDKLQEHDLNRNRRAYVVEQAEALLGKPWSALPATLYMEYVRNGNRSRYQKPYFERRAKLSTLVMAECMEYRGRFLDEIANGIWAICEESTWCIPAHAARKRGDTLHRLDRETIDLFACETGMSLAQTQYLLRTELDGVSPTLCERIRREVGRRILDVYEAGDESGRRPGWTSGYNNWAPWCASNVLGAAMYLEEDRARLARMAFSLMAVVDRFIDRYGEDGGCNEGPGYWNEAGGALLVLLELLHSRTNGAVDIYGEPKIAAMGRYITFAHLDGPYFANFADADAKSSPHPAKMYRYGERVGDEALQNLGLLAMRGWRADGPVDPPLRLSGVSRAVLSPLMEIFWIPPAAVPRLLPRKLEVWLPDLQVLYARESQHPTTGLVLAAKAGHNAESHNHNDVGHFMLYLDGQPGIIDIGRESYTRQTFSSRRYELLFTRGLGHNAPVVNGVEQAPGRQYRATEVRYQKREEGVTLSLNLEAAYPKKAGLLSLKRVIEFQRGDGPHLSVRDTYQVREAPATFLIPMFTARAVKPAGPGRLAVACAPRRLLVEYEPAAMTATVTPIPVEDAGLARSWDDPIYRIAFTLTSQERAGSYSFRFRAGK